jgi:plastocyanin
MILIAALGIGIGWGIGTTAPPPSPSSTISVSSAASSSSASNSSSPFVLTLVLTTSNPFNSTVGEQPAFYVLGPSGLESAAGISLPAHRLIKLVIVNYDDAPANLTGSQYATVSGTQNNSVTVISNDNVNSSQGAAGIQVSGGESVSSLPTNDTAHTFTIPQLGINIPLAPASTTIAYFTVNQTGTFTWFCQTECGSGDKGLLGAMSTPGWMTGNVMAS